MSSGKSNNDSQQRPRENFNLAILQLFLLSPRLLRPIQIITSQACEIPSTPQLERNHTFPRNLPNDPATRSITPVLNPLPSPFPCILVGRSLFLRGFSWCRCHLLLQTINGHLIAVLLLLLSKLNRNSHVETRFCSAPVVMICTNCCSTRVRCNCSELRDRLKQPVADRFSVGSSVKS